MKILFVVLLLVSTQVLAEGGKNKNPWQPSDPDVCVAFLPEGIDLDNCTELASTTSGKTYLCDTIEEYIVTCPEDD